MARQAQQRFREQDRDRSRALLAPRLDGQFVPGEYIYGLVMNASAAGAEVRFGDYKANISEANTKWAGGPPSKLLKKGDLAVFKVVKIDNEKKTLEVNLDQLP